MNLDVAGTCKQILNKQEYCPVCVRSWRIADGTEEDVPFLKCEKCRKWVHGACDGLTPNECTAMEGV